MKLKILLICLFFIFSTVLTLAQESITITTYYPSPYGSYNELRAKRMAIGDSYIDGSSFSWGSTIDADADLIVEENVGIGTAVPQEKLHIAGKAIMDESAFYTDGGILKYPIEARETIGVHDGDFGGYEGMNNWINGQGCPHSAGWHVCHVWEISYLFSRYQNSDTSRLCGGGHCNGWILGGVYERGYSAILGNYYNKNDCLGWKTNAQKDAAGYWLFGNVWSWNGTEDMPQGNGCSSTCPVKVICCR